MGRLPPAYLRAAQDIGVEANEDLDGVWVEWRAVIRRLLAAACCVALLGWAVGCSAAPEPMEPSPTFSVSANVPADGVLLRNLGFRHAPADFSVPGAAVINERVDQENTVVAVFSAPGGSDIAAYLRENVVLQGWSITADGNDSLLFERGEVHGAFTVTGASAALAIRYDERS